MRPPRPTLSVPLSTLLVLLACSDSTTSPEIVPPPEEARLAPHEAMASLSAAPGGVPFVEELAAMNPCTGQPDLITITGIFWILHDRNGHVLWRSQSVITTAEGFQGRRAQTVLENRNVFKVSLNAMLSDRSGQRFRVHFILVVDLATGTVRVMHSGGVCLGP